MAMEREEERVKATERRRAGERGREKRGREKAGARVRRSEEGVSSGRRGESLELYRYFSILMRYLLSLKNYPTTLLFLLRT